MIKIDKFVKQKDGIYLLKLENNKELKIHEDLILKHELLLKKKLDESLISEVLEENKIYDAYILALKYIKAKVRSTYEMKFYLEKKNTNSEIVDKVIALLKKQGYLNNEMFTKAWIHDKVALSNDGPLKIKEELQKHQIEERLIDKYLQEFTEELEKERIKKLIQKQIDRNHSKSEFILKKKMQSHMIKLGYHQSLINELLNGINIQDDDAAQKEYRKLHRKLSKKYSGKDLEYQLKQKMYQRGFFDWHK
ncbi:MAG: RecX family transcriptional regulator [bacterium]|nr:RecX family transcriptional regulator [bacterium]